MSIHNVSQLNVTIHVIEDSCRGPQLNELVVLRQMKVARNRLKFCHKLQISEVGMPIRDNSVEEYLPL